MQNWYVIQVRTGIEDKIVKSCEMLISKDILMECFIPMYRCTKKYRGNWETMEAKLFPGYVFLISNEPNRLFQELKKIPDITKLLGKYGQDIFPLNEDEVIFLKSFGQEEHLVDISSGHIEGDKIIVQSGPLMNREGLIKKIDRHKRLAYIELEFLGQTVNAKVGLEIIKKN